MMIHIVFFSLIIIAILATGVHFYRKALSKYVRNSVGLRMVRDTLVAVAFTGFLAGAAVAKLFILGF